MAGSDSFYDNSFSQYLDESFNNEDWLMTTNASNNVPTQAGAASSGTETFESFYNQTAANGAAPAQHPHLNFTTQNGGANQTLTGQSEATDHSYQLMANHTPQYGYPGQDVPPQASVYSYPPPPEPYVYGNSPVQHMPLVQAQPFTPQQPITGFSQPQRRPSAPKNAKRNRSDNSDTSSSSVAKKPIIHHKRGDRGAVGDAPNKVYAKADSLVKDWGPRKTKTSNIRLFSYWQNSAELTPSERFSREQLVDFFLGQGHPSVERRLTLWIQNVPAQSNDRYVAGSMSAKCRWAGCPADKNTILKGFFRVAFDEWSNQTGKTLDPFQLAGYMHLHCFEKCFDLGYLIHYGAARHGFRVRADTRHHPFETKNPASLNRDHSEMKATYQQWVQDQRPRADMLEGMNQALPLSEWYTGFAPNPRPVLPHEQRLGCVLTEEHMRLEIATRAAVREKRGGVHLGVHKGDLDLLLSLSKGARNKKSAGQDEHQQPSRGKKRGAEEAVESGHVEPSSKRARRNPTAEPVSPSAMLPAQSHRPQTRKRARDADDDDEDYLPDQSQLPHRNKRVTRRSVSDRVADSIVVGGGGGDSPSSPAPPRASPTPSCHSLPPDEDPLARAHFDARFPAADDAAAAVRLPVSGAGLLCGLRALRRSIHAQLHGQALAPTLETLQQIAASGPIRAYEQALGAHARTNDSNFFVDQLGAVLHFWGRRVGLDLQLGYMLADGRVFLLPTHTGPATQVVWVASSSASGADGEGVMHHFEGVGSAIGVLLQQELEEDDRLVERVEQFDAPQRRELVEQVGRLERRVKIEGEKKRKVQSL